MSDATRDRVIVALDQPEARSALDCARSLIGSARWVKVGMTLYYAEGPAVVDAIRDLGFDLFVDLKLHDIPHQVRGAARAVARLGAGMLTVHAGGGAAMVQAAVEGARDGAQEAGSPETAVLAVTVLTSIDAASLRSVGVSGRLPDQVDRLAALAVGAGASGVVCSPQEAAAMCALLGPAALVVTPGVRPFGASPGDQARTATPAEALAAGATHVVIGRPVTDAPDPAEALERIVESIDADPSGARP